MKKVLALVLISGLLLIPFAVFADNVGVVSATIDFDYVFNLLIEDDWDTVDVTQEMIGTWFTDPAPAMPILWGSPGAWNIKVTVQALSDYEVWAGYASRTANFDTLVADELSFIGLDDLGTGTFNSYIKWVNPLPAFTNLTTPGPDTGDHTLNYAGVTAAFTDIGFGGTNNMGAPADYRTYDVLWNPLQLTGDFSTATVNDELLIDIYFVVTDPDV